jgi:hypothetical protein
VGAHVVHTDTSSQSSIPAASRALWLIDICYIHIGYHSKSFNNATVELCTSEHKFRRESRCGLQNLRVSTIEMLVYLLILCFLVVYINAAPMPTQSAYLYRKPDRESGCRSRNLVAAVLPGDPLITGTLSQGVVTSVSLFSNVLLARFALSWFPQVLKQFPVLKPIITGFH